MNRVSIKNKFNKGSVPTETDFANLIDSCAFWLKSMDELPTPASSNVESVYLIGIDCIVRCENGDYGYEWVAYPFTQEAIANYLNLTNKPRINDVVVSGSKKGEDYGLVDAGALSEVKATLIELENRVKALEDKVY